MDYSPEFSLKFHPEHLADLAKSGLTEDTITAAGINTPRPGDITKLVGWDPQGVTSALAFPYPGVEGFCRIKPFPPWRDKDGKPHKYLQRPGSGVPLYITPSAQPILKDPTKPLTFTEGEKKALALHQAGVPAIALGGLDNWMQRGEPIHDLDAIAWADRPINLDDDSDIWSRPELLRRVYAFGWELQERGAKVAVRQIPPVNGARAGADDFLVAHGVEAYRALPCIPLTHKAFSQAKAWHKDWVKRRALQAPSPETLLQQLIPKPTLRFAQDIYEGKLFYGIGSGQQALLLTSGREPLPLQHVTDRVTIQPHKKPHLPLSLGAIQRFLQGDTEDTGALLRDLAAYFDRYMIFPASHVSMTLALWVLGTYVYQLFRLYPYLIITSPTKRCAKTRVLELVAAVSFACRGLSTSPTEATLFRMAEYHGGTECQDEVEALVRGRGEREGACRALLNAGWQRGATVPRMQKQSDGTQEVEEFHVYRPRALAGVGAFAETLEDRGILLSLKRKTPSQRTARLVRRDLDAEAAPLRDRCAIWGLGSAPALAEAYAKVEDPEALRGLDDRARDFWEILWLIADQARHEGSPQILEVLAGAVAEAAGERQAAEQDTALAALLEALLDICEGEEHTLRPKKLHEEVRDRLGDDAPRSPKALTSRLKRLDIPMPRKRLEGKPGRAVILRRAQLEALLEQYAPGGEEKPHAPIHSA